MNGTCLFMNGSENSSRPRLILSSPEVFSTRSPTAPNSTRSRILKALSGFFTRFSAWNTWDWRRKTGTNNGANHHHPRMFGLTITYHAYIQCWCLFFGEFSCNTCLPQSRTHRPIEMQGLEMLKSTWLCIYHPYPINYLGPSIVLAQPAGHPKTLQYMWGFAFHFTLQLKNLHGPTQVHWRYIVCCSFIRCSCRVQQ